MDASILPFFAPRGVVVIGASTSPQKLGYGVARNLIQSGYTGAIQFVGQKQGNLFEHQLYGNVSQVPDPVDLAVLIVPPEATAKTIGDCGRRGIQAAIILSSGFREAGPEGALLEQECLRVARDYGVRLLGPNCIGIIDTHLPLDTSFLQPPMPARGQIGFISQSGAFCAAIMDWARGQGFGFSRIISLGNQVDVNEADALLALSEDEFTQVIVLYMEGVSDGRRFVQVAREVTWRKPVIALKAGRFESGQRAAASHTGALAATDTAFEAAFEKAGILRADTAEQMFDWARALASYPGGLNLQANRDSGIAVLTNAGGPGVIAADALEKNGLPLAKLHESTLKALIAELPPAAGIFNPVDMLASASPEIYSSCLEILLGDRNVDGLLIILPPPPMYKAEDVAESLIEIIAAEDGGWSKRKPVVAALLGSTLIEEARAIFQRSNLPTFPFPERAASALGALLKRAEFLDDGQWTMDHMAYHPYPTGTMSSTFNTDELLSRYGIPSAPIKLARSIEEAGSIASEHGYPVVMKIASPDFLHKSDVGGVELDIKDSATLQSAYREMMARVQAAKPEARIDGVYIQQQIPSGQEVILGAVRDPQFGPLMMFGSGGVEVEGLKDVAFALAPLTRPEASKMIRRTWAGRKLAGFRNMPPADKEIVIDILVKLSHLAMDSDTLQEIEINPLKVLSKGAIAVDVRVK